LKSSGDKASPCLKPFPLGNMSDRCLPGLCYEFIPIYILLNNAHYLIILICELRQVTQCILCCLEDLAI
jgi:hypothetical protein